MGDNEHGAYLLLEWIDVGEGDQESIATALAQRSIGKQAQRLDLNRTTLLAYCRR